MTLLLTFFLLSGCAVTSNEVQEKQLNDLQTSLQENQQQNKALQSKLVEKETELAKSKTKVAQLTTLTNTLKAEVKTANAATNNSVEKIGNKTILGQTEWVYISSAKSNFKGRIDTGATTSSLNAQDIQRFERDGQKWVRFTLPHVNEEKGTPIEAKIDRIAKIVQSSNPGVENERIVVKLRIHLGGISTLTEFTLADRSHMEYPVLIGRTFMQDLVLVDISQEYIHPKYKSKTKE